MIGPYELNSIVTGDARELARAIPDESVDMIFTDPIYNRVDDYRWLAEVAQRILKISGDVLVYVSQYHLDQTMSCMSKFLNYRWVNVEKKKTSGMLWQYSMMMNCVILLWFTKGDPRCGPRRTDFHFLQPAGKFVNHPWAKSPGRATWWLEHFGLAGDLVLDPFVGGGSIVAACKMTGRHWIAFEIDSAAADCARQRIANTQPPLFTFAAEQVAMRI